MLEEELVGLSLMEDGKASQPISPRTIKRPTNPVATCLDATRRFRGAALQGEREVVKRPRLGGNPLRSAPGALVPSPPTLSPAMTSHPRDSVAVSNTPSNAPSTHASPVHRCAFSTRQPIHEGLTEPQPVFAAGPEANESSPDAPFMPPSTAVRLAFGMPTTRERSLGGYPSPMMFASGPACGVESHSNTPYECGSPVALATNSISQNLRLGPPLPQRSMLSTADQMTGLLPPSLVGSRLAAHNNQFPPRTPPQQPPPSPQQSAMTPPFSCPSPPAFPPFSPTLSNHQPPWGSPALFSGAPPLPAPVLGAGTPPQPMRMGPPASMQIPAFGGFGAVPNPQHPPLGAFFGNSPS